MDEIWLVSGLLLAGGAVTSELTLLVCAAIESHWEYNDKMEEYRTARFQEESLPKYRTIFSKNIREVHRDIFYR